MQVPIHRSFVLILVAASAVALCGFARVGQDPAKLPGFGEPALVTKDAAGWATVKFRDLALTIDMPHWPTPAMMEWDEDSSKQTKAWAGYDFASRHLAGDIYMYEPAEGEEFLAEDSREQEIESYADPASYGNVKTEKGEMTIGGRKVLTVAVTYQDGIDEAAARCYFWNDGAKVGSMRLTWWKDEEAAALRIVARMEQSLSFPNATR
jgi:hypothetical protein